MNNKIINFLNILKLAYKNNKNSFIIINNKNIFTFIKILYKYSYIRKYEILTNNKIKIYLLYYNLINPIINDIHIYSKYNNSINYKKLFIISNSTPLYHFFLFKQFSSWLTNNNILLNNKKIKYSNLKINFENKMKIYIRKIRIAMFKMKKLLKIIKFKRHKNKIKKFLKLYRLFLINNKKRFKNHIKFLYLKKPKKLLFLRNNYRFRNTLNQFSTHNHYGLILLSTPKGIFSHIDAYKKKLSGKLICKIY